MTQFRNFGTPSIFRKQKKSYDLQIGTHIGRGQFLPMDHKLAPKWAWPGVCDPILKFWDPLNISQTGKATIFKFGTHIGRGQFLPRTTNWPEIGLQSAGAGAYCGGHLAAQLVKMYSYITVMIMKALCSAGVVGDCLVAVGCAPLDYLLF